MIHPAEPPPPGAAQILRDLALPIAAFVAGFALFIRTAFF